MTSFEGKAAPFSSGMLTRVLVPNRPALAGRGIDGGEERPRLLCPSRIGKGVVARALLRRKRRIAELDRPLLDVETELREGEGQIVHATEEPGEDDPIEGGEVAPEDRVLVVLGEAANIVADVLASHSPSF